MNLWERFRHTVEREHLLAKPFNLYAMQATTSPATPLVVVNGPWSHELGFNSLANCLGPSSRANATLGRFVRLVMNNLGGGRSVSRRDELVTELPCLDYAPQGFPAKYTFCCSENELGSPWEPLHVEQGFARADNAVTVIGVDSSQDIRDVTSSTAHDLGLCLASAMRRWGSSNLLYGGYPALIVSPDHARMFAEAEWTKAEVREFLFERARVDMRDLPPEAQEVHLRRRPSWIDIGRVPVCDRPGDLVLIVTGGAGIHAVFLSTFGSSRPTTACPTLDADGRFIGAEVGHFGRDDVVSKPRGLRTAVRRDGWAQGRVVWRADEKKRGSLWRISGNIVLACLEATGLGHQW